MLFAYWYLPDSNTSAMIALLRTWRDDVADGLLHVVLNCAQNLNLAFATAESRLGLHRLLDATEMAATGTAMGRCDEKSVMTYVIELRKRLPAHVTDAAQGVVPIQNGSEDMDAIDDGALNVLVAQNLAAEEITFDA
jgi:hypothetical protein